MSLRPTDEQRAKHLETFPAWLESDDMMARIARDNPKVEATMRELHTAGLFLQELTLEMGFDEATVEDLCFKLGRVALGRDPWDAFDKLHAHAVAVKKREEDKKRWAATPVPQEIPPPTDLFNGWYGMARNSVGDDGVYPQQYHRVASDGGVTLEAVAMGGGEMMKIATERLKTEDVAEFVMGIDMSRPREGDDQGNIEFADFLAVIWLVDGEFYTGVINYQKTGDVGEDEEPAFREVDWANNYWSNSLREYPIEAMIKARSERLG